MAGAPGSNPTGGAFTATGSQKAFNSQLKKVYTLYTGGFIVFVVVLAIVEQMGLSAQLDRLRLPVRDHRCSTPASAS